MRKNSVSFPVPRTHETVRNKRVAAMLKKKGPVISARSHQIINHIKALPNSTNAKFPGLLLVNEAELGDILNLFGV